MKDISTKSDIKLLVDNFYDKVNKDNLLGPVFNNFAEVNWNEHLPKMYEFWSSLLLGSQSYRGRPFDAHVRLPLTAKHFDQWINLFTATVDELFVGEKADEAKVKAQNIAGIFKFKMHSLGILQN